MRAHAFFYSLTRHRDAMTPDRDLRKASVGNDIKGSGHQRMAGRYAFSENRQDSIVSCPAYRSAGLASRGFTLMELVITLAVAAILAAIALPDFSRFIIRNRIVTQANGFVAALSFSRSEAIRRQEPVTVCASNNGQSCNTLSWQTGWIVYGTANNAPTVFRVGGPFANGNIAMTPAPTALPAAIIYNPDGSSSTLTPVALKFCDQPPAAGDMNGIQLTITGTGQVTSTTQNQPCP